jgi:hypothetical protein
MRSAASSGMSSSGAMAQRRPTLAFGPERVAGFGDGIQRASWIAPPGRSAVSSHSSRGSGDDRPQPEQSASGRCATTRTSA